MPGQIVHIEIPADDTAKGREFSFFFEKPFRPLPRHPVLVLPPPTRGGGGPPKKEPGRRGPAPTSPWRA